MLKFMKKNAYYIMLGVCVLCIGIMITVSIVSSNKVNDLNKPTVTNKPSANPSVKPVPTTNPVDILPTDFILPVTGATVSQDYSSDTFVFSETLNQWETHLGVDFATEAPSDVLCVADGKVEAIVTDDILSGGTVIVSHNGGLKTVYKSLGSEIPVEVGAAVKAGDKLGVTSMSAYSEFKEGNHLHFEMVLNEENVNPNDYLKISK